MVAARNLGKNLSVWQRAAWLYHDMSLNVIPLGNRDDGRKQPRAFFEWEKVGLTRWPMRLSNHAGGFELLLACFDGACNVGLICGDVSENLFVIDCENMEIFWLFAKAMKARNIPLFAQKTGRGAHILLKGDKPVKPFTIKDKAGVTLYEVRSNGQYIVAAPSYHPNGGRYQWMSAAGELSVEMPFLPEVPKVAIESIDFLQDENGNRKALEAFRPTSTTNKRRKQFLSNGQNTPEGSRQNEVFGQANYSRFLGIPKEQAERELAGIAIASGLTSKEAYGAIDSAYSYSQKAQNEGKQARMIDRLLAFAEAYQWAFKTDRRVFEALIMRYKQDAFNYENGRFSGSIRNLSELSALNTKTVQKAIKRFCDTYKLLKREGANARKASVYSFTDSVICDIRTTLDAKHQKHYLTVVTMSHNQQDRDLKERGGLGDTGLRILRFLQSEYKQHGKPVSAAAIAEAVGVNRRTIYRYLDEQTDAPLIHYRLVIKQGKGWVAFEDSTAEKALAQGLGVLGKAQERKEKHALERSLAIVGAMHKQIVARDKNHPLHHTTKTAPKPTPEEIQTMRRENMAKARAAKNAQAIAPVLRPDFVPVSASGDFEAMLQAFAQEHGAKIRTDEAALFPVDLSRKPEGRKRQDE